MCTHGTPARVCVPLGDDEASPALDAHAGNIPSGDEPTSAPSRHCAYPGQTRRTEPSGLVSDAISWSPRALSDSECAYSLSEPLRLPPPIDVAASASGREISFSYDVNLDGVSDVFVRPTVNGSSSVSAEAQAFELWISELDDGKLHFRHEPCVSLDGLVAAWRFFVRDINDDQVPDLVVGMQNSVQALLNTPEGWVRVLDYHWEVPEDPDGWTSILDVAVADVIGDGSRDLVLGFDRNLGANASTFEVGVLAFPGQDDQGFAAPTQWVSRVDASAAGQAEIYWGGFAVHQASSDSAQLLVQRQAADGSWQLLPFNRGSNTFGTPLSVNASVVHQAWGSQGNAMPLLAVLVDTSEATSAVDYWFSYDDNLFWAGGPQTEYTAGPNRELGGGALVERQYFMDIDGNGVNDFIEWSPSDDGRAELAIHRADLYVHFETLELLQLPRPPARNAAPFLQVEDQVLGLIAYDGVVGSEEPMLQQFQCLQ